MRNRAKCKLCSTIIESFHRYDYISCDCGEISIEGGADKFITGAKDYANFLRIDDLDRESPVKVQESNDGQKNALPEKDVESKPSRRELIEMLVGMAKEIERLPDRAMQQPINQYEYYSLLTLLSAIFKAD